MGPIYPLRDLIVHEVDRIVVFQFLLLTTGDLPLAPKHLLRRPNPSRNQPRKHFTQSDTSPLHLLSNEISVSIDPFALSI